MSNMSASATVTLNNGRVMPLVGLGTWKSKPGEVKEAVLTAIKNGYRHIDAAYIYSNENEVGDGIKEAIDSGIVRREDLWITSKLWNDSHASEDVEKACRESLRLLKLDYLDLYLIHWPCTPIEAPVLTPSTQETWLAMERLVEKGLTKTIGVSNFTISKLEAMKAYCTISPAVNQVELHPMWQQNDLLKYCNDNKIHLTAYSPLGSPDSSNIRGGTGTSLLNHEIVKEIASETGKSCGQILIRWAFQRGTSVIPKSVTPCRIIENFDVFSWELSPSQMKKLASFPQERFLTGTFWLKKGGPYSTLDELWA